MSLIDQTGLPADFGARRTPYLRPDVKATQILQFTPGSEMRPSANPKVLRGYCQACKGDLYAQYSGSAL